MTQIHHFVYALVAQDVRRRFGISVYRYVRALVYPYIGVLGNSIGILI